MNIRKYPMGLSQNRNKLSFCHPERSEGSRIHKLMHTRFFAMLRIILRHPLLKGVFVQKGVDAHERCI